ncbi:hypothetical protein CYMTET_17504, partial [Cymbomonas tetramitiformis]
VDQNQDAEASNLRTEHDIIVRIIDSNGEIVTSDSTSMVEIHFNKPEECTILEGDRTVQAVKGQARFSGDATGLIIKGNPGTACQVYFSSDFNGLYAADVESSITEVPLRYCETGEELKGELPWQYCVACKAGWLSLDNESACVECEAALDCYGSEACPLKCPGRDEYVVCQGSYLAPQAQHCGDPKEGSTQCLLDRLYTCENSDACTTASGADTCDAEDPGNAGRVGRGTNAVAELQLCKDGQYAGNSVVMCGGTLLVICSNDHHPDMSKENCLKCSSREEVMLAAVWACAGIMLLVGLVIGLCFYRGSGKEVLSSTSRQLMSGEAQSNTVALNKAMVAGSLMIGYFQVMAQFTNIYSSELLPNVVELYVSGLGFAKLEFSFVINMDCIRYHFLQPEFQVASHRFGIDFWQAVFTPYILCAFFMLVYMFLTWRRRSRLWAQVAEAPGGDALRSYALAAQEIKLRTELRVTCIGGALFFMMLFHPSVSTTMFQLFNCHPLHFDDEQLAVQYWLKLDSTMECFTRDWTAAACFAVYTVVTYVIGYPLALYFAMRHLRLYHHVRMPRQSAELCIDRVHVGEWIPCHPEDKAMIHLYGSWVHEQSQELADIFMLRSSFMAGVKDSSARDSKGSRRKSVPPRLKRSLILLEQANPTKKEPNEMTSIRLNDGRVINDVLCPKKREVIDICRDEQPVHYVPMTRLDNELHKRVFGQFRDPFEDEYYYWQCYEICRRMAQTGMVVLVSMLAGENAALLYAVIFSVIAMLLHQRFSPYKHVALDELQFLILMNQFASQIVVFSTKLDFHSNILGYALVVMQLLLIIYTLTLFVPAYKPLISQLMGKLEALFATFSHDPSHEHTLERESNGAAEMHERPNAGQTLTPEEIQMDSISVRAESPGELSVLYHKKPQEETELVNICNPVFFGVSYTT